MHRALAKWMHLPHVGTMNTYVLAVVGLVLAGPVWGLDIASTCRELEKRFDPLDEKAVCQASSAPPELFAERGFVAQMHESLGCRSAKLVELALDNRARNGCNGRK